ncbi:MAG: C-terminal binding protein [Clostridia bacterium]|nr:C-terminal binding protein [Clostridia bacterium]
MPELKIVVTDCSWNVIDVEKKYLPSDASVKGYQCKSEEEVIAVCEDADAILSECAPFSKNVLEKLKKCKIISNTAVGVDNIDVEAASDLGIAVANVPGYCAGEVADHTVALMLAFNRDIIGYHQMIKNKAWRMKSVLPIKRMSTQTMGLIGFGDIAQAVTRRALGFGMKILVYSRRKEKVEAFGLQMVELDELLEQSDIVSIHCALNERTEGLIYKEKFLKMKKKPLLINTSRGKVVDGKDLIEALEQGLIRGAALDVLENEPPNFSNPLFKMENVIITPHAGFYSEEALEEVRRRSALNIKNYLNENYDEVSLVNGVR